MYSYTSVHLNTLTSFFRLYDHGWPCCNEVSCRLYALYVFFWYLHLPRELGEMVQSIRYLSDNFSRTVYILSFSQLLEIPYRNSVRFPSDRQRLTIDVVRS